MRKMSFYARYVKRPADAMLAAALLLVLWPLLAIISALLLLSFKGRSPFFYQLRPGRSGRLFRIVKFKTMNEKRDNNGQLLSDGERMTCIGKVLRQTSLDELPQLWNVLRGEMSFIGPRPLLKEYLPLYNEQQARRHEVRPGITGWAQVNGRNAISWQRKFELDTWYVDHLTLSTDMRIILKTIKGVLMRKDISAEGEATIQPFQGN